MYLEKLKCLVKQAKWILLITSILMLSPLNQSYAVDGYKDLKFGITKKQVSDSNICSFAEVNSDQVGVEFLSCDDFKFGNRVVEAGAFFINNQFLRFVIVPNVDDAMGIMQGLMKKYGNPSSSSTPKELQAVDSLPNQSAFIAFDSNTVIVRLMSDENHNQSMLLIYTSPQYDILLQNKQQQSVSDDL